MINLINTKLVLRILLFICFSFQHYKYRYANGKVLSESDYGSEYGSGHGELQHENGGRGEQSDIGTYQSQNYQQSTLGRNRH